MKAAARHFVALPPSSFLEVLDGSMTGSLAPAPVLTVVNFRNKSEFDLDLSNAISNGRDRIRCSFMQFQTSSTGPGAGNSGRKIHDMHYRSWRQEFPWHLQLFPIHDRG